MAHFCSMCGPKFCSMELTQQLRSFAEERNLEIPQAVEVGLREKAAEYRRRRLEAQEAQG